MTSCLDLCRGFGLMGSGFKCCGDETLARVGVREIRVIMSNVEKMVMNDLVSSTSIIWEPITGY